MQDSTGPVPKQLLSERIKNATNILVTVSRDPSVDELSAALALTVILNKMDKHATAVFSGKMPPAISFLNPEKTFEGTVDSLRDFIIALDKEKADRLRYKVEDDVVRIFITPYRTVINEHDLAFSQGDFNVELIIAIGVESKDDLDTAISAHGRILHDATVATVNISKSDSSLGSIDWTDDNASSYSEMMMGLSESLKSGILDEQIATALLTGIVAATERFSNTKTTPKVMTMSAQLMAAGANQQLIATKLEEGQALPAPASAQPQPDGSKHLQEGSSEKVSQSASAEEPAPSNGEMHVDHGQPAESSQPQTNTLTANSAETALDAITQQPASAPAKLSVADLKNDLAAANKDFEEAAAKPLPGETISTHGSDWHDAPEASGEPLFGGTLNATTDEARAAKEREDRMSRNHTILNHDEPMVPQPPLNAGAPGYVSDMPPSVDPFAVPPMSEPSSPMSYEETDTRGRTLQPLTKPVPEIPAIAQPEAPVQAVTEPHIPTIAELEAQAHGVAAGTANSVGDARAAVSAALESLPFDPASQPLAASGAQPLSQTSLHADAPQAAPTFAPTPAAPYVPAPVDVAPPPTPVTPIAAPVLPALPPLPDFSTLPPLPSEPEPAPPVVNTVPQFGALPQFDAPPAEPTAPAPAPSNDPGQFKLPGQ